MYFLGLANLEKAKENGDIWSHQDIKVMNEDTGKPYMLRKWHEGMEGIENETNPLRAGNKGYYGDWEKPNGEKMHFVRRTRDTFTPPGLPIIQSPPQG